MPSVKKRGVLKKALERPLINTRKRIGPVIELVENRIELFDKKN